MNKTKGVSYVPHRSIKKPYRVRISISGKTHTVGHYATEEEAANAFQEARKKNPVSKRGPMKGTPRFRTY